MKRKNMFLVQTISADRQTDPRLLYHCKPSTIALKHAIKDI